MLLSLNLESAKSGSAEPLWFDNNILDSIRRIVDNQAKYGLIQMALLTNESEMTPNKLPALIRNLSLFLLENSSETVRGAIITMIYSCTDGIEKQQSLCFWDYAN